MRIEFIESLRFLYRILQSTIVSRILYKKYQQKSYDTKCDPCMANNLYLVQYSLTFANRVFSCGCIQTSTTEFKFLCLLLLALRVEATLQTFD